MLFGAISGWIQPHRAHQPLGTNLGTCKAVGTMKPVPTLHELRDPRVLLLVSIAGMLLQALLMLERPLSGQHHRYSRLVASLDDFPVPHRTSRLDHCGDALTDSDIHAVPEREKGIGNHGSTL